MAWRSSFAAALVVVAGCNIGGQTGEEGDQPCVGPRTSVGAQDAPFGFTASDVVNTAATDRTTTITYDKGQSSTVRVTIEARPTPNYTSFEPFPEYLTDSCGPGIEMEVLATFRTDDGVYDETISGTLFAPDSNRGHLRTDKYAQDVQGSVDLEMSGAVFDPAATRLFST